MKGLNTLKLAGLRLSILTELYGREVPIGELTKNQDRRNPTKIINQLEEAGLIKSIQQVRSGKLTRLVSLTPLTNELLIIIQNMEGQKKLPAADKELVSNYIKKIINLENEDLKSIIIEELVHISARNTIDLDNNTLQILSDIIFKEKSVRAVKDLLKFINNLASNQPNNREILQKIFEKDMKKIFTNKTPFSVKDEEITRRTVGLLQKICGSDAIYEDLWSTYITKLESDGPEVSTPFREMLKEYYPNRQVYIRKRLIDLFGEKKSIQNRIKEELNLFR